MKQDWHNYCPEDKANTCARLVSGELKLCSETVILPQPGASSSPVDILLQGEAASSARRATGSSRTAFPGPFLAIEPKSKSPTLSRAEAFPKGRANCARGRRAELTVEKKLNCIRPTFATGYIRRVFRAVHYTSNIHVESLGTSALESANHFGDESTASTNLPR